ncbi:hypothetical protein [Pacificibacter marinus]|uniref:Uncharacterized protein n=1 Tax=Pacificibacter marinus TaxID=658057 RepID=A0A1Y5SCJ7_9RHOB|nr:hypothetical protein [Pacificibacter marinus]SEK50765.1 hypothetical protein SAMN04488032_103101 [Pacificibacter marinus]SLN37644.1 hypothetical protein PAM7971_01654 [Pacificibacter marinus]
MRAIGFIAALAVLPACQMGLPVTQNMASAPRPDTDGATQTSTAQAHLSDAFEQAALGVADQPKPQKKSLFGFLKPAKQSQPSVLAGTEIEVVDGAQTGADDATALNGIVAINLPVETAETSGNTAVIDAATPTKPGLGGVFGFLKRKPTGAPQVVALKAPNPLNVPISDTQAVVPEGSEIPVVPKAVTPKRSLLGLFKSNGQTRARHIPLSTVARGEVLPFGTVGITCEARKKDMGKAVAQFPHKGKATWQLFDTDPTSITPRTQYITGFSDGCARQVTAALILFGAPSLHEVHRYSTAQNKVLWSSADNSYEAIKSSACGVPHKTPCPAGKIESLEQNLAFVSIYKQFGDAKGWLELLLHDGSMKTQEMR